MLKLILFLSVIFLITTPGCFRTITHSLTIISEPPGCNVEIDGNLIGKTPVTTPIKLKKEVYGLNAGNIEPYSFHINIYPSRSGQYTQHKSIYSEDIIKRDATTVYFNMNLIPSPKKYEFDIKNR